MHVFARKYADKLKEVLADIAKEKAELQKLVNDYNRLDSNVSSILDLLEKIIDSKKEIESKNQLISKTKEEIHNDLKTIQDLEEEIHNLKSSDKFAEFLSVKKGLESFGDGDSQALLLKEQPLSSGS